MPVLFIHGEHDEAIPVEMARRLYQATRAPRQFYLVSHAGHNDTYVVGASSYFNQWQTFLEECLQRRDSR